MTGRGILRLRRAAIVVFAIFVLLLGTAGWLVGTERGTRFAVETFLEYYNDWVPGGITVEKISGSLLGDLTLEGLSLLDRADNPIIDAKRVVVDLVPRSLLEGVLHASNVRVESTRLFIRFYGEESSFIDLGPKGDDLVIEPDEPFNDLSLPLSLAVDYLHVNDTHLFFVNGESQEEFVTVSDLSLYGTWSGGDARFRIETLKAGLTDGTIALTDFSTTVGMENGTHAYLENARATTNRGDLEFTETTFDIDTKNGGIALKFLTDSERFSDLANLPAGHEVEGQAKLTLLDGEQLSSDVSLFLDEASLHISAAAAFSTLPAAAASFELRRVVPQRFGLPVDGLFGGDGTVRFSFDKNFGPNLDASFTGVDCTVSSIGPLALSLKGALAEGQVTGHLESSGRDTTVAVQTALDTSGRGKVDWQFKVKNLRSFKDLIPMKRPAGKIDATGSCTVAPSDYSCAFAVNANKIAAKDISISSLKSNGEFGLKGDDVFAEGLTKLKKVRLPGIAVETLVLNLQKRSDGFDLLLNGGSGRHRAVQVDAKIRNVKDTVEITLDRLESDLGGMDIRLAAPGLLVLGSDRIALGPAGITLQMAEGEASIFGTVEKAHLKNVRILLSDINLHPLSRLLPMPGLFGTASAEIALDGALKNPTVALTGSVSGLSVQGMAPLDIDIDAALKKEALTFSLDVRDDKTPRLHASGQAGLLLDLSSGKVALKTGQPMHADFDIHKLTELDAAAFVTLPDGLSFEADADGNIAYTSTKNFELKGTVKGFAAHPLTEHLTAAVTFDIAPEKQLIALDIQHKKGLRVQGDLNVAVSLPKLKDGVLKIGPSTGDFTSGKSSLSFQVDTFDGPDVRVRTQFAGLNTALVSEFIKDFPVIGIFSGSAIVERSTTEVSLTANLTARNFSAGEYHLDACSATLDWREGVASVEASLQQSGRTVFSANATIPLVLDPISLKPTWHTEQPHFAEWRVMDMDITSLLPVMRVKNLQTSKINGKGKFEGTVKRVNGDADLHAVLTHKELGVLPLNIDFHTANGAQEIVISMLKGSSSEATLKVSAKLNFDALRQGQTVYRELPFAARFDMKSFNLKSLNVLDLSPLYDISGTASCSVKMHGSLAHPIIVGHVLVKGGTLSLADLEDPLTDLEADLRFSEGKLALKKLLFKSGQGSLAAAANGIFSRQGDLSLRAALKARNLRIGYEGLPVFLLTTDTDADLQLNSSLLRLNLNLKETNIEHKTTDNINVKKIPTNENVRIVEKSDDAQRDKIEAAAPAKDGRNVRFTVKTVSPLRINGAALDTKWKVDIDTLFQDKGTEVKGKATLTKGSFDLFANTFAIDKAGAFFTVESGLDPHIQLSSSATLPDAKIFLQVSGTVGDPRLKLYSEPAMPQEAILSMLISGSADDGPSGAGVLANVIAMKYPVVTNILQNKFGIDRVAIGAAPSGDGTVVKLGKRMSDKLYFYTSFNLNAAEDENDYDINFEYDIVDRVTLDTMAGNEVSSVDIGWRVPLPKKKKAPTKNKR